MFSLRRVVFGLPLLVVASIAAQLVFNSRRAGTMVAAHWESPTGLVDVTPADNGDATAYFISWRGCSPDSNFDHSLCTFASGMAPRSAVNAERTDTLGLDLDISMLSLVFGATEEECFSGSCSYRPVTSAPLHGTFTIFRGPGSSVEESNGSTRRDSLFSVYPVYPIYPVYPSIPSIPSILPPSRQPSCSPGCERGTPPCFPALSDSQLFLRIRRLPTRT